MLPIIIGNSNFGRSKATHPRACNPIANELRAETRKTVWAGKGMAFVLVAAACRCGILAADDKTRLSIEVCV